MMIAHRSTKEKANRPEYGHTTVLLQESVDGLAFVPGDIFIDGTLGSGGHSEEVARRFGKKVKIIGMDMDADAVNRATKRFKSLDADATFIEGNFRNLDAALDSLNIKHYSKLLLDLGLSSNQFEESGRGFTFHKDEPLSMSFKKDPSEEDIVAKTILNEWGQDTLEVILKGFGEERYARRIAKAIAEYRLVKPIATTQELVDIVLSATPKSYHHGKIHPATRTFQALRIATNDELGALKEALKKGFERLKPGGRIAVISFHSLEDRIVKNFFKDKQSTDGAHIITKKPITPSEAEITNNRRARSAKLRILEK